MLLVDCCSINAVNKYRISPGHYVHIDLIWQRHRRGAADSALPVQNLRRAWNRIAAAVLLSRSLERAGVLWARDLGFGMEG